VVADRWHTGIVDAAGTGGLLADIDGRTAAKVAQWIAEQPDSWRAGITHVAIDLSASYLRAVTDALPNAVVVADRFYANVVVMPMSSGSGLVRELDGVVRSA